MVLALLQRRSWRSFGVTSNEKETGWLLDWNYVLILCALDQQAYGMCSPLHKLSKMSKIIKIGLQS
jgi:hypothetical protein